MFPPLRICSINLEAVSMIDAAKLRRFSQSCKKNNLVNGSVLLGTVIPCDERLRQNRIFSLGHCYWAYDIKNMQLHHHHL